MNKLPNKKLCISSPRNFLQSLITFSPYINTLKPNECKREKGKGKRGTVVSDTAFNGAGKNIGYEGSHAVPVRPSVKEGKAFESGEGRDEKWYKERS
jgi:hypothetical protein